ncbi:DUF1836 domain-containing protein [Clostridium sp. MB40-C1]|uniref:DUF1836 domain-containing protein n=1 Tax=Clostridium sp. MB40-C1 TaxID=3070996 RepID=UPI0027DF56D7|nr:DUF1836 domain-containing protein [Clostridium sp. MB40-C1]WMJ80551.1 DUF1836 domain-containing protein [Clostridium sp. MB40-C1]
MSNYKEDILNTINNLNLKEEIQLMDIPKLDLYMDQVITLFETGLNGSKRNEDDKILTKTMINNYTKDKILMPAKNKKYSRNHIIMMILIYNLKQSLAITDIKTLLSQTVENFNIDEENLELDKLYEIFLNIKNIESDNFNNQIGEKLDLILNEVSSLNENNDYYKILLTVLMLINKSNMYKKLAENIIDNYL